LKKRGRISQAASSPPGTVRLRMVQAVYQTVSRDYGSLMSPQLLSKNDIISVPPAIFLTAFALPLCPSSPFIQEQAEPFVPARARGPRFGVFAGAARSALY